MCKLLPLRNAIMWKDCVFVVVVVSFVLGSCLLHRFQDSPDNFLLLMFSIGQCEVTRLANLSGIKLWSENGSINVCRLSFMSF